MPLKMFLFRILLKFFPEHRRQMRELLFKEIKVAIDRTIDTGTTGPTTLSVDEIKTIALSASGKHFSSMLKVVGSSEAELTGFIASICNGRENRQ